MDPKTENNPYLGFIYTSFQERATKISHGATARHASEFCCLGSRCILCTSSRLNLLSTCLVWPTRGVRHHLTHGTCGRSGGARQHCKLQGAGRILAARGRILLLLARVCGSHLPMLLPLPAVLNVKARATGCCCCRMRQQTAVKALPTGPCACLYWEGNLLPRRAGQLEHSRHHKFAATRLGWLLPRLPASI